jgi:hypothetical protein
MGTGLAETGFSVPVGSIATTGYGVYSGTLTNGIASVPEDLTLRIWLEGGSANQSLFLDDLVVMSDWTQQIVGPNEIDAADGLAPLATIVSSNSGSGSNNTYLGSPNYSPGQAQLVFFKDSVQRTSSVPPENQLIRLSYRSSGPAVGRVQDATSVTAEATKWGDDGVRSVVRADLNPRPRSSVECELAAAALVAESSFPHYEGSYTQFSTYFTSEPRAGAVLKFTNLSDMADVQAEEVNEVVTTVRSDGDGLFEHIITFGKPDHIRRLLAKFDSRLGAPQLTDVATPAAVDATAVGTSFAPDVTKPEFIGWDLNYLYFDAGQDLGPDGLNFEIRYTDQGWGAANGKNLVTREGIRTFRVPRSLRGKLFFIKQNSTGCMSRFSSGVHISFPADTSTDPQQEQVVEVSDDAILEPVNQIVKATAASKDITLTLPPESDMRGKQITVVKVAGDYSVIIKCVGSDVVGTSDTAIMLTEVGETVVLKGG